MLRFGKTKIAKEKLYGAKKTINIWGVNANNIVASKLIKTKTNSKSLTGHLDETLKYVKTFIDKDG